MDKCLERGDPLELLVNTAKVLGVGILECAKLKGFDLPVLVAGRQRLKAAREAGLPEVEYKLVKGDILFLTSLMIKENALHTPLTPMQNAREAKKLLDMGMSQEQVACVFGKHVQSVKDWMTVLTFDPKVHEAIEAKRISAYEALTRLRKVQVEEQGEALKEILANKDKPVVRPDGRPAPKGRRERGTKQILRWMSTDTESPLSRKYLLLLEFFHGNCTKKEVFEQIPEFKKAFTRAERALKKQDEEA